MKRGQDGSAAPARIFSFSVMVIGESGLHIYIYSFMYSKCTTLYIHKALVRGLQGVSDNTAQLPHFELRHNTKCKRPLTGYFQTVDVPI